MINPITIEQLTEIPLVDNWQPNPEDIVFNHTKDAIILPVSQFYGVAPGNIDYFILVEKVCYNKPEMRQHITHYLNYFLNYYDQDKELLMIYYRLKYLIDYESSYTKNLFINDIKRYILSGSILYKVSLMNRHNYNLNLTYKNNKDPSLQYTDRHGSILMKMSVLMNMIIPLLTHYIYIRKIDNTNGFLLEVFDIIIHMFGVDMYNKFYETSISNINKNKQQNNVLWNMQDIRGKNATTHALATIENIILNIMPKYIYSENIIVFNFRSIQRNIGYQITDIGYEYNYINLSSSKRDMDNQSDFDRFESFLSKSDESLYIQNKVNCEETMKLINITFGPFDQDEINFYKKQLQKDGKNLINNFQKELIFNIFYKYFGDPTSIKAINSDDYIKLMISAKKFLEANGMIILPYIISSRINRLVVRKNINKKELTKLESSAFYGKIRDKYKNEKIEKQILSIIATILSSEFQLIDHHNEKLNGLVLDIIPDIICEEILMYINLI